MKIRHFNRRSVSPVVKIDTAHKAHTVKSRLLDGPTNFLRIDVHALPYSQKQNLAASPESKSIGGTITEHPDVVMQSREAILTVFGRRWVWEPIEMPYSKVIGLWLM